MLNEEEIKKIVTRLDDVEQEYKLEIIQQYIFDLKQQEVIINKPIDGINFMFMQQVYQISKQYYLNKFNEGSS